MLPLTFVSKIFARVRETVLSLSTTDVLILVIATFMILGLFEVLCTNLDSLARGVDPNLTTP